MAVVSWQRFNNANLRLRVISAVLLAPLVLLIVWRGGWVYAVGILLIVVLGLFEWLRLTSSSKVWKLLGIPYLGGFGFAMLALRSVPGNGMAMVYYLLAVVWGTDVGAYLAGRLIGGPKLAPSISPGKTWAGFFGGMALATILGYGVGVLGSGLRPPGGGEILTLFLSIMAQLGDLFESWLKRRAGVKESGYVIPGHGGVLDRIDGLIFAAILFVLFVMMTRAPG